MSRIGRKPVAVPANVKVAVNGRVVSAEGPKGKLEWEFRPEIRVEHDAAAKSLTVSREQRRAAAPCPPRPDPRRVAEHDGRRDPGL